MLSKHTLIIAALALAGTGLAFASGPDFRPDIRLNGENLNGWHQLGQAEWKAENGEIVGKPNQSAAAGWSSTSRIRTFIFTLNTSARLVALPAC